MAPRSIYAVNVTKAPSDCQPAVYALVLVKSWQTARAAEQLAGCLAPEGVALTLQNGIGNLEVLRGVLGPERAALGVTTTGATLLGPGYVRVGGTGPTHIVPQDRLTPLVNLLSQAGFIIEKAEDLEGLVWGKLAVNAGINPLTALLKVPNGELLQRPDAKFLMLAAARETASVAEAKGLTLPYEDPEERIVQVALRTAENHSSMYQDIQESAPTEIDAICGAIVHEGHRLDVPTPINETLWHLVRALVNKQEEAGE